MCFSGDADAAGDSAGEADWAASAFLCERCLAGDADVDGDSLGEGDGAAKLHVAPKPVINRNVRSLWCMSERVIKKDENLKERS